MPNQWVSPFSNAQVPTTTQSVANYNFNDIRVAGQQVLFPLSWAWTGGTYPIAYNTIISDNGATPPTPAQSIMYMPPAASGTAGFATFIYNKSTSNAVTLQTYTGAALGSIAAGSVLQVILLSTANDTAASWLVMPMNVPIETITDPSSVAGQGLAVADDMLYVTYIPTEIDLSDYDDNTLTLTEWNSSYVYTFMFASGIVVLPSASGADAGKANIFKNLTNGSIYIQVPSGGEYFIDVNIILQGATIIPASYGLTTITLLPNEAMTICYNGQVTLQGSTDAYLYTLISKVNSASALTQQAILYLPNIPPAPQPQALDVSIATADVIFITDANQAAPASGSYAYLVQYPIAKIYYFGMQVVNSEVDIPTVTISFGTVTPANQVVISPSTGLVEVYVTADGVVISAVINESALPFATQLQANTGTSTNTIISPATLAGTLTYRYTDITDTSNGVAGTGILTMGDIVDNVLTGTVVIGNNLVKTGAKTVITSNTPITGNTPSANVGTSIDGSYAKITANATNGIANDAANFSMTYAAASGDTVYKPSLSLGVAIPTGTYANTFRVVPNVTANGYQGFYSNWSNSKSTISTNLAQYTDVNGNVASEWMVLSTTTEQTGLKLYRNSGSGLWMRPELASATGTTGLGSNATSVAFLGDTRGNTNYVVTPAAGTGCTIASLCLTLGRTTSGALSYLAIYFDHLVITSNTASYDLSPYMVAIGTATVSSTKDQYLITKDSSGAPPAVIQISTTSITANVWNLAGFGTLAESISTYIVFPVA